MTNDQMTREEAIALLGGSALHASIRIGVSQQAVSAWPAVLTPKLRDRVQAALWREHVRASDKQARDKEAYRRAARREAALLRVNESVERAILRMGIKELADQQSQAGEPPKSPNNDSNNTAQK